MIKPFDFKAGWVALWLLAWVLVPCVLWAGEASTAPHFALKAEGDTLTWWPPMLPSRAFCTRLAGK